MFSTLGWKKQRCEVELVAESSASSAGALCELGKEREQQQQQQQQPLEPADCSDAISTQWLTLSARHDSCSSADAAVTEVASVRQKAQYFEALIRSNTDTIIRCVPSDMSGGGGRGHSEGMDLGSDDDGASETEQWQDKYAEVQLVLRMPRAPQRAGASGAGGGSQAQAPCSKYGSVGEMEELIERLQAQLAVKEREKQLTASSLARKTQECDNLMRVVRELADSRAKAVSAKVSLQEKYIELQAEFHRSVRVAELSRTVSKENLAKTSRTQKALRQTEDELRSSRKQAAHLQGKSKKLKTENVQLKEKISLLERLDAFEGVQESACMREFTRYRVCETY